MPSGAKRRKAAKKKNNNINSLISSSDDANDVLKPQESDGGETSSNLNNEVEKMDTSIVPENSPNLNGGEDAQNVEKEDVSGVDFGGENFEQEDSESKDVDKDHVNKSLDRSSSSSSNSSSSDHESKVTEHNLVESEPEKLKEESYTPVFDNGPAEENYNLVVETEGGIVNPVFEEVIPLTEGTELLEKSTNSDMAELSSVEKDEQLLPSSEEKTGDSVSIIDIESNHNEDMFLPLSYKNDGGTSDANVVMTKEKEDTLILPASSAPVLETSTSEEPALVGGGGARQQVQTTSWKSCCGLLDVLNR